MTELQNIALALGFFVLAFIFSSFVEYWIHRLMHYSPKLGKRHRDHHQRNEGQGVLPELRDYLKGGFMVALIMFSVSWAAGIGWFSGSLVYAAFSAYAHQLQHDNPTKCFWMKMPVHYVHHKYNQWHHNFGLAVDWWDHVFGTYQYTEWLPETELIPQDTGALKLKWW